MWRRVRHPHHHLLRSLTLHPAALRQFVPRSLPLPSLTAPKNGERGFEMLRPPPPGAAAGPRWIPQPLAPASRSSPPEPSPAENPVLRGAARLRGAEDGETSRRSNPTWVKKRLSQAAAVATAHPRSLLQTHLFQTRISTEGWLCSPLLELWVSLHLRGSNLAGSLSKISQPMLYPMKRDRINFVMLNVDNTKWEQELDEFGVEGIPHFAFLDKEGNEEGNVVGKLPKQYFLDNVVALASGDATVPHARAVGQYSSAEFRKVHQVADPRSHG
uniref:Uncharacterized protein n=1 Tax=Avena sativa TaxID=4498 RepID=A0ACD5WBL1_AVESA